MEKIVRCLTGLVVTFTFTTAVRAQSEGTSVPRVLQITREYTKPGKAGQAHEKTEAAFVQAMATAKWPVHYLAMTSLSGKQRALFMTRYPSFEAYEKDGTAVEKNAALSAALERANLADGELLESEDQGVFVYEDEMSLRPRADLSHMRFMEISVYHVRPGHEKDWEEAVKMVRAAYEKAVPEAHWGMFRQMYGGDGGTYLVLTAHETLAQIDRGLLEDDKKFTSAMGEDGMKKLEALIAAGVESSQHQLFAFSPSMSYIYDDWIKSDPDYWKPKATTSQAKTSEDKKVKDVAEKKAQQ
jgi:hypothetical protein